LKESSDGETLIAVDRFQICGAAEEKARHPKSVFIIDGNKTKMFRPRPRPRPRL